MSSCSLFPPLLTIFETEGIMPVSKYMGSRRFRYSPLLFSTQPYNPLSLEFLSSRIASPTLPSLPFLVIAPPILANRDGWQDHALLL